ncbi:MAG: tRNA uridine-5-carboxymethylaminomethyl(34) synthesis GTPase MnmE [Rhizobiaceae bacterium]
MGDTIFALSSGQPPAGVAVFRISGPATGLVLETICGVLPAPRLASLRTIRLRNGEALDQGLVIWFPAPGSFTGEDCAELHVHGGRSVIHGAIGLLGSFEKVRLADRGEFTRRAFENGKLDLTEAEGLSDLIAAETDLQRRLALGLAGGHLRQKAESWRESLIAIRSSLEASFDFSDQEDVPGDVADGWRSNAVSVRESIRLVLENARTGERVRDGLNIVIAGPPNAGKSSLLNAFAKRDVAIVDDSPGTTRDLVEVSLDVDGVAVTVVDTAGLRDGAGKVEAEGIRRALQRAQEADLTIWLQACGDGTGEVGLVNSPNLVLFRSKDDDGRYGARGISVRREGGLDGVLKLIWETVSRCTNVEPGCVTRERQRLALEVCESSLALALECDRAMEEVAADHIRSASNALGRLTGKMDVEDVLDRIFSEFCIGK